MSEGWFFGVGVCLFILGVIVWSFSIGHVVSYVGLSGCVVGIIFIIIHACKMRGSNV